MGVVVTSDVEVIDGQQAGGVLVNGVPVIRVRFATVNPALTAVQRAQIIAARLQALVDAGLAPAEVAAGRLNNEAVVQAKGALIITADALHARANNSTPDSLAREWAAQIAAAIAPVPVPAGVRDARLWPFDKLSAWNYPIGRNARYVDFQGPIPRRRPRAGTGIALGGDSNTNYTNVAKETDPTRKLFYGNLRPLTPDGSVPIKIPDGWRTSGGERIVTVVQPDGRWAHSLYGASKDANFDVHAAGAQLWVDLHGSGWGYDQAACHGWPPPPAAGRDPGDGNWCMGETRSAGCSNHAGNIRRGELLARIPHAIAMITGNDIQRPGHVWPAGSDDGDFTGRGNYRFGQLVAIPWDVDVEALPLRLPQSRVVARALQRYGAYSVDSSPGLFDAVVDTEALDELQAWQADGLKWEEDVYETIGAVLRLVENSYDPTTGGKPRGGVKLDGGDGQVDQSLIAPDFAP